MPEPCNETCSYPCARDHRTKREKIEAQLGPKSGASEGEKTNARAALANMKPEPKPASPYPYQPGSTYVQYARTAASGQVHRWDDAFNRAAKQEAERRVREQERAAQRAQELARERLRHMSLDELMDYFKRYSGQYSTSQETFAREYMGDYGRYPYGNEDPITPQHIKEAVCKLGGHDWVVIGQSMMHTEIKRCTSCGEYDPPRKEAKRGP